MTGQSDFAGMTVNERLYLAGLLSRFDEAVRCSDRATLLELLGQVDLPDQAQTITDAVLAKTDPNVLSRTDATPKNLNRAGCEIWFKPVLGSYWPCHWKGVVLGPAITLAIVPSALLLSWLFPTEDWVMAVPLAVGVVVGWVLIARHTK